MSLLNPALLAGLGLAVIPILLHLLMRAKPKRLIFPALRLIQQRRKQNTRRLQLRHLWLLLLRVLVIALIALALTRPSLPAANYGLNRWEWGTLIGIGLLAVGGYFAAMHRLKQRTPSRNELLTRRTMLRGGIGAGAVLLALAGVAWPYTSRIWKELKDPSPRVAENVPVAAVFLFDTSASMSYKQSNRTRLQDAQRIAKDHLGRLPTGSKVAVAASHEAASPAFSIDLQSAQTRIEAQEIKALGLTLNERLRTILLAQEDDRKRTTSEQASLPEEKRQDRFVREVYLFTDLAKSAWSEDASSLLKEELERLKWLGVYIIDVGEADVTNAALTGLRLSREAVPAGGTVRVDAVVSVKGLAKPDQIVELHLREEGGSFSKRDQQPITVEQGTESRVTFLVEGAAEHFRQGELRLVGSDPLAMDDVVSFTVQTFGTIKVLVVAESRTVAEPWLTALTALSDEKVTAYQTTFLDADGLSETELKPFDVVCLINASSPTEAAWTKLREYVEAGGGLAVFLGANSAAVGSPSREKIDPVAYQRDTALSVLPARLVASLPLRPERTIDFRGGRHPILQRLDDAGTLTDLGTIDIRRHWKVDPLPDAITIARYGDSSGPPALVERRVGEGRVLMMTTAVDGIAWNSLLDPNFIWPYFILADQSMQYLSRQAGGTFNLVLGDDASLAMPRDKQPKKVIVRVPDFTQRTQDVPETSRILTLQDLGAVGSYTVAAVNGEPDYRAAFSVNRPASESDLTRLEESDLNGLLGENRYKVSPDPESLVRIIQYGRLGVEMYPTILTLLIIIFAAEQFTATWFYRTDES